MTRSRSKELSPSNPSPRPNDQRSIEDLFGEEAVLEFTKAIDDYRRQNNRPFPTWSEVLIILHSLGYKKVEAR